MWPASNSCRAVAILSMGVMGKEHSSRSLERDMEMNAHAIAMANEKSEMLHQNILMERETAIRSEREIEGRLHALETIIAADGSIQETTRSARVTSLAEQYADNKTTNGTTTNATTTVGPTCGGSKTELGICPPNILPKFSYTCARTHFIFSHSNHFIPFIF